MMSLYTPFAGRGRLHPLAHGTPHGDAHKSMSKNQRVETLAHDARARMGAWMTLAREPI